jgi:gamma-glutamylcysteine synthetase
MRTRASAFIRERAGSLYLPRLGSQPSTAPTIHPRPLPKIVRVNELAAEVHLDELRVAATGEAIGDVLLSFTPVVSLARATDNPRQKRSMMMQFLPRTNSADSAT